jgi:hypothetical protein
VVAAGRCGPSNDAASVTRPPPGPRLADLPAGQVGDEVLDEFLRSVLTLRASRTAR